MIQIEINKSEYSMPQLWEEISLSKMQFISNVCQTIPEDLRLSYEREIDQVKDGEPIEINERGVIDFFCRVINVMGNVPVEVLQASNDVDVIALYKMYCERFVLSCVFGLVDFTPMGMKSLEHEKEMYWLPETKTILEGERPFYDRTAIEFTECMDLINAGRAESNAYKYAHIVMSILCRPKYGESVCAYEENRINEEEFKNISMAYVLEVFAIIEKTLTFIKNSHPVLFDNSGQKVRTIKALNSSGLKDYGWFASIVSCCNSLNDLEKVKQSNFHDWIMYLAVKTAESKFKNN